MKLFYMYRSLAIFQVVFWNIVPFTNNNFREGVAVYNLVCSIYTTFLNFCSIINFIYLW